MNSFSKLQNRISELEAERDRLKDQMRKNDEICAAQNTKQNTEIDRLKAELHDHKIGWGMAQKEIGIQKSKAEKLAEALDNVCKYSHDPEVIHDVRQALAEFGK